MQAFFIFFMGSGQYLCGILYLRDVKEYSLVKLHIFNPENDLALADGNSNYCPPPAARAIAHDLATLPLWYAGAGDAVLLQCERHNLFCNAMNGLFPLALPLRPGSLREADTCLPWGWSAQVKRRLLAMGVSENVLPGDGFIATVRSLSNRQTAIGLLQSLRDEGIDTPELPQYYTSFDDIAQFITSMPRSVLKAPWSGSGKGIAWGIGRVEVPVEHFCKGVIRRQGGVVCERFLDKVVDFAMEFKAVQGEVAFAGYSLFTCDGSAYSGNILASDAAIEDFLVRFVDRAVLQAVKERLSAELSARLRPIGYSGYLGVDMLVYRSQGGAFRLYPCVELNLRMNMGAVSRIFYDRYAACGVTGRFVVANFRNRGEALQFHGRCSSEYPLQVCDGRVVSGYLNLSPVAEDTSYLAYAIVCKGPVSLHELYECK